jgi:hypothetical protein
MMFYDYAYQYLAGEILVTKICSSLVSSMPNYSVAGKVVTWMILLRDENVRSSEWNLSRISKRFKNARLRHQQVDSFLALTEGHNLRYELSSWCIDYLLADLSSEWTWFCLLWICSEIKERMASFLPTKDMKPISNKARTTLYPNAPSRTKE